MEVYPGCLKVRRQRDRVAGRPVVLHHVVSAREKLYFCRYLISGSLRTLAGVEVRPAR